MRVVGIAIDGRFGDGEGATEAARDVRRMAEFMNLSYPIVFDGGELLAQFGDPRQLGAELPLYVVIGADGRVLHYHVGLHEMDTLRGLVALDEIVVKALRANQNAAGDLRGVHLCFLGARCACQSRYCRVMASTSSSTCPFVATPSLL